MELTTSTFALVKELGDFSYELSALDRVWNILFPDKGKKWNHLHVNKYKHTFRGVVEIKNHNKLLRNNKDTAVTLVMLW